MQTTYHLSSAQDISSDILDAIKIAFKSKAISITIKEKENNEISDETKKMLDDRLNEYLQNPTDVQDFDEILNNLEISLIEKGKKDIEKGLLIPHKEAKERIKNHIKSKSL
jgi:predicted transcriptional regulator